MLVYNLFYVISAASAKQQYAAKTKPIVPKLELPSAVNHLFLAKQGTHGKNRYIAAGPRIANMYPVTKPVPVEQTRKSVQPITPHIVGDTKCKWVQKQKQDSDKDGSTKIPKSPASSPKRDDVDVHGKEIETNNEVHLRQESDDLKAFPDNTKERNDGVEKCLLESGGSGLNDSGLGISIHSLDHSSSVGAVEEAVGSVVIEGLVKGDSVLEKSETLETVIESSGDAISDAKGENEVDQVMVLGCKGGSSQDLKPACECFHEGHCHQDCSCSEWTNLYKLAADSVECKNNSTEVTGIPSAERETASDVVVQSSAKLSQSVISGANKESDSISHQVVNGDVVNRSHTDKMANKIDKCRPVLEVIETKLTNSTSTVETYNQEFEHVHEINMNNNSVSKDTSKPKIVLSDQPAPQPKHEKKDKNCSKFGQSTQPKMDVSHLTDPKSASVSMYYSNKKNLAAKSSSFDDHLQAYRQQKMSFNPFPVKHVNTNRARTGVKLGLYKQSTLDEYERNLRKPVWGK